MRVTLSNYLAHEHRYVSLIKVFTGVLALFASAQIAIPIKPVPITFHTVMVSLIALTYSPKLSFITLLTYLTAGMVGLPMFSKMNSGLNYMMGATAGYLLGFLIAAPIMGIINSKVKIPGKFFNIFFSCLIGHLIIYSLGVGWLSSLIGFKQALYSGFIIYIPTGLLKIAIFSWLFSNLKEYNSLT